MPDHQNSGTLQAYPPEFIASNPYQHHSERRFRGEEFDALVEDIRVNGVHQPPPARLHPEVHGKIQLQMGHRRFAAWQIARPGEPFTVIVKPLDDLMMLEGVIEENIHRTDLNDIERAQMIDTYKKIMPAATNADLARVFRLKNPASITNIRKLLQLPEAIQMHVANDKLPDALARQLVGVSKVNPKAAQKIADAVAKAPKSEKQDTFEQALRNTYYDKLVSLGRWSLDWLEDAPIEIETDLGDGDYFLGACAGCVFNVGGSRCARKICRDEKQKLFAAQEVERVAHEKKIATAGSEEKVIVLFKGEYGDDDRARDLLNARKEIKNTLRVVVRERDARQYNYLERLLGSSEVTLATTDKSVIDAYFAERTATAKGKTVAAVSVDKETESAADRAARVEQERKEMEEKRAARSKMWKSYYDAQWLLENAARTIGLALADGIANDTFAAFIESEFSIAWNARGAAETIVGKFNREIKEAEKPFRQTQLRMANVALHVIAEQSHDGNYHIADNEHEYMFEQVRDAVMSYCVTGAEKFRHKGKLSFGVEIETYEGWDVPPVHHTPFNCWHCGQFAGNVSEKLTKRDLENGWIDLGADGVFCSAAHKDAYANANAQTESGTPTKQKRAADKPKRKK